MIELPRACIVADQIAKTAEFFSFGTNDLTQTGLGMSRDDYGSFIRVYTETDIIGKDPEKWRPKTRETADHSMPYMLARALMDGGIYLDAFAVEKFMDPKARALMARMTFYPQPDWNGNAPARITIRKKNGEQRVWDSFNGVRTAAAGDVNTPMTDDEINQKFDRVCAYMRVDNAQRDRAKATWSNLSTLSDIGDAIRTLQTFGRPAAL